MESHDRLHLERKWHAKTCKCAFSLKMNGTGSELDMTSSNSEKVFSFHFALMPSEKEWLTFPLGLNSRANMALLSWARLVNRRSDRVILPWKSSSEYKTNLKREGLPRPILPHTYTVSTAAVYVELKHPHGLENDDCHRKKMNIAII